MREQTLVFAIVVEGGVVQQVVSAGEPIPYRLLDFDGDSPEEWTIGDGLTDDVGVDIEIFSRSLIDAMKQEP